MTLNPSHHAHSPTSHLGSTLYFGDDTRALIDLVDVIKTLYARGELPATSGNFSLRRTQKMKSDEVIGENIDEKIAETRFLVSESGIDKSKIHAGNFLQINDKRQILDGQGFPFNPPGRKVSDETDLHLMVYRQTDAHCVLHSHHPHGVVLSRLLAENMIFRGLEILKGLRNQKTHEIEILLPIFDNNQDIEVLTKIIEKDFHRTQAPHGFYLRGHGLYTWGRNVAEAKRHSEVYAYLFQLTYLELNLKNVL